MSSFTKRTLFGLFGLFIFELVVRRAGAPVDLLVWYPFSSVFSPHQLVTRFFVQGAGSGAVTRVLIGLLVLYFFLDQVRGSLSERQFAEALGAVAVGSTVVGLTADSMGLAPGPAMGWTPFVTGLVVLFGLSNPNREILLFLVLPIGGMMLVWATVVVTSIYYLAEPGLHTVEELGAIAGVWGWWAWRGPGGRRRVLKQKARHIERELHRFQVIDGGRNDGNNGDDIVH